MATIRYDEERQMPKRRPRLKLSSRAHWAMYLMLTAGLLGTSGFLQAGAIPDPLPLSTPQFRISYRGKELWIIPPSGPAAVDGPSGASGGPASGPAGIDQVAVASFDSTHNALRVNALLTSGGVHTPADANQVFTSIYDRGHNAIQINCVLGCGGGGSFTAAGDLSGSAITQTVIGLQTRPVAATAPTANQVLAWSGSAWSPTTLASGGAGAGACAANQFVTGVNVGSAPTCVQPSFANLTGVISPSQFPAATGTSQGAIVLAGDIAGSATNPLVAGLQGRPVGPASPSSGQALTWNGSAWTPTTLASAGAQIAGDLGGTLAMPTVVGLQTRPVAPTAPTPNQVLAWTGSAWSPATPTSGGAQIAGDLGGTLSSPTVIGLQRVPISSGAPSSGQCLVYNGTNWGAGSCSSGSGAALLAPATSQTIQPTAGNNIIPLAIAPATGTTQTADLFDVWKDSAMTTKAIWVDASGALNFAGNNATYGTAGQSTQSFLRLYGSTTSSNLAPPYLDLEKEDGSVKAYLAPSTSTNGLLCTSSGVPGGDCGPTIASTNFLVSAAGGTAPATSDCVKWISSTQVGDSGGPCGGVGLQTNGINNGSQTALNLVAGTNITLSNSGANTTISAATGSLPASWNVAGTTNAVTGKPAANQDATTLALAPSLSTGGTADIFDVCSALPCSSGTKYFSVGFGGAIGMNVSNFTLSTSGAAPYFFLNASGGQPAQGYLKYSTAELPNPTGCSASASGTANNWPTGKYWFECTYVNAAGETINQSAFSVSTTSGTNSGAVAITAPGLDSNAFGYQVYCYSSTTGSVPCTNSSSAPAQSGYGLLIPTGSNCTLSASTFNSNAVCYPNSNASWSAEPTPTIAAPPSSNTTGNLPGAIDALQNSAEGYGLCSAEGTSSADCAAGTGLMLPGGTGLSLNAGTTPTTSGAALTGMLGCLSGSLTAAECAANATNAVGVFQAGYQVATVQTTGIATINLAAAATTTAGHFACTNATAGTVVDSASACAAGQQAGYIAQTNGTSVTSVPVLLTLSGGNGGGGGSTLYSWQPWLIQGSNAGGMVANKVYLEAVTSWPSASITLNEIDVYVNAADTTGGDVYSVGVYGPCAPGASSCSLAVGSSATAFSTTGLTRLSVTSTTLSPPASGQYYYIAWTGNAGTATLLLSSGQIVTPVARQQSSTTSSGGSLPSSIAIPAASWGADYGYDFALHN